MHKTQIWVTCTELKVKLVILSTLLTFFRNEFSVLGIFMCVNAPCFLFNSDQKAVWGGKNWWKTKKRVPRIHNKWQEPSENSKSDRNDSVTEKTAREWRLPSCLSEGGYLKSKSLETRVRSLFQIANPTVLEKPGALMLAPIYELLFGKHGTFSWSDPSLELTEDQIAISYKTYKSNKAADRRAIVNGKLTPGKLFRELNMCLQ